MPNSSELAALLERLIDCGLGGIEVFHSEHAPSDCESFAELARSFDLVPTGGSDFHGENKPGVQLGTGIGGNLSLPYELLEGIREMRQGNNKASKGAA